MKGLIVIFVLVILSVQGIAAEIDHDADPDRDRLEATVYAMQKISSVGLGMITDERVSTTQMRIISEYMLDMTRYQMGGLRTPEEDAYHVRRIEGYMEWVSIADSVISEMEEGLDAAGLTLNGATKTDSIIYSVQVRRMIIDGFIEVLKSAREDLKSPA